MFVETSNHMRSACAHLIAAVENLGDNRQEVARAFDDLQEVQEMIYRRTGKPSFILASRESVAYAVQTVVETAAQGHTMPYKREVLQAGVNVLQSAGYNA